jgi:hypothetical protein
MMLTLWRACVPMHVLRNLLDLPGGHANNATSAVPHLPGVITCVPPDYAVRPCVCLPVHHGTPDNTRRGQPEEGLAMPALFPAHCGP